MPRRRQLKHRPLSPKQALGEAIRQLGPDATHDELARFAKDLSGLDLHFVLIVPRSVTKLPVRDASARPSHGRRKAG
jgi:hypothetical protein